MTIDEHDPIWKRNDYLALAACFIPAAILTWGIHEFAHWLMGEALGYDMWLTFNQAGLEQGDYATELHQVLVSLAGPAVTWFQAVIFLIIIRRSRRLWLYSFLFLPFWMRTIAMVISLISNPNDEARISLLLGWPVWLVPTISVLFVFTMTYLGNRTLRAGWKSNLIAYVMSSIVTGIIIFADQLLFFSN